MLVKGWCPSLEKPMESGDGFLVRIPIEFGRTNSDIIRNIAELSIRYGNGFLDLSGRGNLQLRGVRKETYYNLREELAQLGFVMDFALNIIANPLDKKAQEFAEELRVKSAELGLEKYLPEKFLIVIDGGKIFPLSGLACDLYINSVCVDIRQILFSLKNIKKCHKKQVDINAPPAPIGFVNLSQEKGIFITSPEFGRIEAEELRTLADIAEKYSGGEVIFAPFRRIILPDIVTEKSPVVLQDLLEAGFITKADDSRLNIHACVGAPACSSAFGETRPLAKKWAKDNPKLTQIVHITGCSKGCAYRGKADIIIDFSNYNKNWIYDK